MGIFRKKDRRPEEVPPEPTLREDANWHEWAERGFELMAEGSMPKAVSHWVGAIDRFGDDSPKQFAKFRTDMHGVFSKDLFSLASNGQVFPTHMVAEIDTEIYVKLPGFCDTLLCEELFYDVKERVSSASGPEEASALFTSGSYGILGYLRYSTDPLESIGKCHEVIRLGNLTAEQCQAYGKNYAGRLKPKYGDLFCRAIVTFFENIADHLEKAVEGKTLEELDALRAYRRDHMDDRLQHLGMALQLCINSSGAGHISKRKFEEGLEREVSAYVDDFLRTE